jgi:hypothetical protein
MKKFTSILAIVLVGLTFQGGCAFNGFSASSPSLSASTSTSVVVNAEKTLAESKLTIETFLQLEHNHRAFIKKNVPAVHSGAETLRRTYEDALLAGQRAKNAFKNNMTSSNQADLNTAVQTVVQLATEAKNYTNQINNATP